MKKIFSTLSIALFALALALPAYAAAPQPGTTVAKSDQVLKVSTVIAPTPAPTLVAQTKLAAVDAKAKPTAVAAAKPAAKADVAKPAAKAKSGKKAVKKAKKKA